MPTPGELQVQVSVSHEPWFGWPAFGPITTYFGPRHPHGIDIGLNGSEDIRIFASAPGVVVFAGGERCCDYGLNVVIEHEGGFRTVYGHLDSIDVVEGQGVRAGDVLGRGGDTGLALGRHLHFEIRDAGGAYLDPLDFLPVQRQVRSEPLTQRIDCSRESIRVEQASFTRVVFSGAGLAGYDIGEAALRNMTAASGGLAIRRESGLAVMIETPPGFGKAGAADEYLLAVTLSRSGSSPIRVECPVLISYFAGLPDIPITGPTDAELVLRARATATAQALATLTPRAGEVGPDGAPAGPLATPTPTVRATRTPTPSPTPRSLSPATPRPPPPTATHPARATTPEPTSTPEPQPTATPRAPQPRPPPTFSGGR